MRKSIALSVLLSVALWSDTSFYDKAKEGWHYYKEPPKQNSKKKRKDEDRKFIASLPLDKLNELSAEEFSEMFEKVRKIAVMEPSQENILAYKAMMKFSVDQSELFAINHKLSTFFDDSHEYHNIGHGGFSNDAMRKDKNAREQAKHLNDNVVFVSFIDKGKEDELGREQILANLALKKEFGVDTRVFSLNDYPEMKLKLGIKEPVENFVFYRDTKKWQRIRRGIIDAEDFVKDYIFFEENKDNFKASLDGANH